MRIQDLERDFGRTLFDRGRRGARITAMGRELMRYAEEVLRLSAEMRERLAGSETMPGVLRIGVVEMISVTWLPRLVKAIHKTYPKLALELDEARAGSDGCAGRLAACCDPANHPRRRGGEIEHVHERFRHPIRRLCRVQFQ